MHAASCGREASSGLRKCTYAGRSAAKLRVNVRAPRPSGAASAQQHQHQPSLHVRQGEAWPKTAFCTRGRSTTFRLLQKLPATLEHDHTAYRTDRSGLQIDDAVYADPERGQPPMTVDGAVQKTSLLLAVAMASAAYTWSQVREGARRPLRIDALQALLCS
jgi:hypothetical protein